MGDTKYLFAIAGIRCLSRRDPGSSIDQDSDHRCMCDAGITSYCSRLNDSSTASTDDLDTTETQTEHPTIPFDNLKHLFDNIHAEVYDPDLKLDLGTESPGRELDGGVFLLLFLLVLICVLYAMFRCTWSGSRASAADQQTSNPEAGSGPVRPAGGAGAGAVANGSGGGGGGGGGAAPGATPSTPPADLPPSYELVCEENVLPPTYEEVMREEAKISPGDAV